jgi:ADP-heptose:LPS heptosyltransferase
MNVDTMRRIDRLAGVPLCAGATFLLRLRDLVRPHEERRALMVSNDSGPAHFVAAAGLPTIVLFGPETPKLYQPLGNSRAIYAGQPVRLA